MNEKSDCYWFFLIKKKKKMFLSLKMFRKKMRWVVIWRYVNMI